MAAPAQLPEEPKYVQNLRDWVHVGEAPILNEIVTYIDALRAAAEAMARENVELRAEVKEWACDSCNTVYPGPPQAGFACVQCPKCHGNTMPKGWLALRRADNRAEQAESSLATLTAQLRQAQKAIRDADALIRAAYGEDAAWRAQHAAAIASREGGDV